MWGWVLRKKPLSEIAWQFSFQFREPPRTELNPALGKKGKILEECHSWQNTLVQETLKYYVAGLQQNITLKLKELQTKWPPNKRCQIKMSLRLPMPPRFQVPDTKFQVPGPGWKVFSKWQLPAPPSPPQPSSSGCLTPQPGNDYDDKVVHER